MTKKRRKKESAKQEPVKEWPTEQIDLTKQFRPNEIDDLFGNAVLKKTIKAAMKQNNVPHAILLQGPFGCLHGDTKIHDPVDNTDLSIKDRFKKGISFSVFSYDEILQKLVVAKALPPVQYSPKSLYRVKTAESSFVGLYEHYVRSYNGQYFSVGDLHTCSDIPLHSILEPYQEAQLQDGFHYLQTKEDFLDYYLSYLHLYDEQLLFLLNCAQAIYSSLNGALLHNHNNLPLDDLARELRHTHTYQSFFHLSKLDSYVLSYICLYKLILQSSSKTCESIYVHNQTFLQSLFENVLSCINQGLIDRLRLLISSDNFSFQQFFHTLLLAFFSTPFLVSIDNRDKTTIKEITYECQDFYYDFHVPIYNNYWAENLIHHNSGKTTIARILAQHLECSSFDLKEIDVADFSGIAMVREIRRKMGTKPMKGKVKVWILDEVALLGKGGASEKNEAQSALLKALEEPPAHCYFFLCTTDPQNVLGTIKSRCVHYTVQTLSEKQIYDLLQHVSSEAEMELPKKVGLQIARDSLGHPRNALKILEKIMYLEQEEMLDAAKEEAEKREQAIALCRAILNGKSWKQISEILKGIKDEPETVRRAIRGWFAAVLLNGTEPAFIVLDCFKQPFYNTDGKNELVRCVYEAHQELHG